MYVRTNYFVTPAVHLMQSYCHQLSKKECGLITTSKIKFDFIVGIGSNQSQSSGNGGRSRKIERNAE